MPYDAEVLRKLQEHYTFQEAEKITKSNAKTLMQKIRLRGHKLHRVKGSKKLLIPRSVLIDLIEEIQP